MNELNPRNNSEAVAFVQKSIEDYGYLVPIVIDSTDTIIAGHTRFQALWNIFRTTGQYENVLCILVDELTEEQIKQFMIVDNQVAGIAEWDFDKLEIILSEMPNFSIEDFGEIKGFREPVIAEDITTEPDVPRNNLKVQIGHEKFEWEESAYHRWASHVAHDHNMSVMDFVISRLEINEADWTFPETPDEI